MNISIISPAASGRKKKVINPKGQLPHPHPLYFEDMNYNHGFPPGPGPPGGGGGYYGPPAGGGPYPPPLMQFDPYGNPIHPHYPPHPHPNGGGGYHHGPYPPPSGGGPYPGYSPYHPPQQGAYAPPPTGAGGVGGDDGGGGPQFVRRDPHAPIPPEPHPPQQSQYPSSTGAPLPAEERILRNPHPHVPTHSNSEESYDPRLPTYNATPIYHQPQFPSTQKPQIIAPTLNSIFEIAAERVSKKMELQQQEQEQRQLRERERRPSGNGTTSTSYQQPPTGSGGSLHSQMLAMQKAMAGGGGGPTEIITGLVTQMQDHFGMVSGEIFFQTSTVVGGMPSLGDKVVVEAERVTGMPFKFNGKRVQLLSKDLISSTDSKSATPTGENGNNELFERRGGRDFGPLPSMPHSLNLGGRGASETPTPPPTTQLKSILKRNPPPPPILSASGRAAAATKPRSSREEKLYRPESPSPVDSPTAGFTMMGQGQGQGQGQIVRPLFSLDLRNEFPVIKQPPSSSLKPLIPIQDLYPELLYVKNTSGDGDNKGKGGRRRSSRSKSRSRSHSPRRSTKKRDKHGRSRSKSRSPRSSRVRKSRSRSRTPPTRRKKVVSGRGGSRSRSATPPSRRREADRRRSKSPHRSTTTHHKSSRSSRSRSRSTSRSRGGGARDRGKRRKSGSRTPPGMKKSQSRPLHSSRKSSRSGRNSDEDDDIQILDERSRGQGQEDDPLVPNPFGTDSEIKAVVVSSTLFPRIKKKEDDDGGRGRFSGQGSSDFRKSAPTAGTTPTAPPPVKGGPPAGGIKFHIPPLMGPIPTKPKLVPNPLAPVGASKILQNPSYTPFSGSVPVRAPPPATATTAKGTTKPKKNKEQAPAFVIKDQNPPKERNLNQGQGGQNGGGGGGHENETFEEAQLRRINELKSSLHAQKLAKIREEERYLLDQKKALELELSINQQQNRGGGQGQGQGQTGTGEELKSRAKVQELQRTVSDKLKGLRQNWDQNQAQAAAQQKDSQPQEPRPPMEEEEDTDKVRETIQYQKFLDEERRLKLTGDVPALSALYKREERRRRWVEEQRLERLRLDEMRLKKGGDWGGLIKLRESFGGTAERETELMNLKRIRKKEEMAEEQERLREEERARQTERTRIQEEEEFHRRIRERSQRGEEGPVRRLVMDTQIRQLAKAEIVIPNHPRGTRSRSRSPSDRVARNREREHLQRSPDHQVTRSPGRERGQGDRRSGHASVERGRRSRSRSRERNPRRRSPPPPSRSRPRSTRSRSRSRGRVDDREQVIMAQMEAMRRQEEELAMREREIHARMEMMQQHVHQQQQQHHQQQAVYFDGGPGPHPHPHHHGHHHPQYFDGSHPPHFDGPPHPHHPMEEMMDPRGGGGYMEDRVRRY